MSGNPVVIVAESGADIPASQVARWGIEVVPMYVTLGDKTFDDGAVASADMLARCAETGQIPRTSASTPSDFSRVFDRIHAEKPDARIGGMMEPPLSDGKPKGSTHEVPLLFTSYSGLAGGF